MDHPPIPPNCKYFKQYLNDDGELEWWFISRCFQKNVGFQGDPVDSWGEDDLERGIIASVVRCAWLDIMDNSGYCQSMKVDSPEGLKYFEAEDNAMAWKRWGGCLVEV
jgi:hypothetical protein